MTEQKKFEFLDKLPPDDEEIDTATSVDINDTGIVKILKYYDELEQQIRILGESIKILKSEDPPNQNLIQEKEKLHEKYMKQAELIPAKKSRIEDRIKQLQKLESNSDSGEPATSQLENLKNLSLVEIGNLRNAEDLRSLHEYLTEEIEKTKSRLLRLSKGEDPRKMSIEDKKSYDQLSDDLAVLSTRLEAVKKNSFYKQPREKQKLTQSATQQSKNPFAQQSKNPFAQQSKTTPTIDVMIRDNKPIGALDWTTMMNGGKTDPSYLGTVKVNGWTKRATIGISDGEFIGEDVDAYGKEGDDRLVDIKTSSELRNFPGTLSFILGDVVSNGEDTIHSIPTLLSLYEQMAGKEDMYNLRKHFVSLIEKRYYRNPLSYFIPRTPEKESIFRKIIENSCEEPIKYINFSGKAGNQDPIHDFTTKFLMIGVTTMGNGMCKSVRVLNEISEKISIRYAKNNTQLGTADLIKILGCKRDLKLMAMRNLSMEQYLSIDYDWTKLYTMIDNWSDYRMYLDDGDITKNNDFQRFRKSANPDEKELAAQLMKEIIMSFVNNLIQFLAGVNDLVNECERTISRMKKAMIKDMELKSVTKALIIPRSERSMADKIILYRDSELGIKYDEAKLDLEGKIAYYKEEIKKLKQIFKYAHDVIKSDDGGDDNTNPSIKKLRRMKDSYTLLVDKWFSDISNYRGLASDYEILEHNYGNDQTRVLKTTGGTWGLNFEVLNASEYACEQASDPCKYVAYVAEKLFIPIKGTNIEHVLTVFNHDMQRLHEIRDTIAYGEYLKREAAIKELRDNALEQFGNNSGQLTEWRTAVEKGITKFNKGLAGFNAEPATEEEDEQLAQLAAEAEAEAEAEAKTATEKKP